MVQFWGEYTVKPRGSMKAKRVFIADCNILATCAGDEPAIQMAKLSTYNEYLTSSVTSLAQFLIATINKVIPITLPWGTPSCCLKLLER